VRQTLAVVTLLAASALLANGLLAPCASDAQAFGRLEETQRSGVAYFFFAKRGEPTVQLYVWGNVKAGIYEVPDSTGLDKLLSMAGGLPVGSEVAGAPTPEITIRVYRGEGDERHVLYEARAESLLVRTDNYPALRDQDVVVVERFVPRDFGWRDTLEIFRTAVQVLFVVLQVRRLLRD
jgi:hypothetical protein